MIYVTSDLHLYHENIIKYTNRPFADVQEMNATLIENWNKTVKEKDDVYILGDFTMRDETFAEQLLRNLHGQKYLVKGNHDYFAPKYKGKELKWIKDYHELKINKNFIVLCHYPFAEWNRKYHGAYHLHGHQHNHSDYNVRQRKDEIRRYDVGVDANAFAPVSLEKIIYFFNKKEKGLAG